MEWVKALFSSSSGVSMMRVLSFISCLAAIAIAFHGIDADKPDYSGLSILCGVFLGAAFGGKVAQKGMEKDKKE